MSFLASLLQLVFSITRMGWNWIGPISSFGASMVTLGTGLALWMLADVTERIDQFSPPSSGGGPRTVGKRSPVQRAGGGDAGGNTPMPMLHLHSMNRMWGIER